MSQDDFYPAAESDDVLDSLVEAVAKATPPAAAPMTEFEEAVAAVDNTLHHAINHWQDRALKAEAKLAQPEQEPVCIGWDDKTDTPIMGYTTPPAAQPAPVQEPVARLSRWGIKGESSEGYTVHFLKELPPDGSLFYTTPPAAPAAAQPAQQEPVAFYVYEWINPSDGVVFRSFRADEHQCGREPDRTVAVPAPPAAQRQWVGLTGEEEDAAFEQSMEVRPKGATAMELTAAISTLS